MASISYDPTQEATALTLYDKIWQSHLVDGGGDGSDTSLIFIDRHLVHEVTSPQAFDGLRAAGRSVRRPDCTLCTSDHNVPTDDRSAFTDAASFIKQKDSKEQVMALERNVKEFGLRYWGMSDARQGIVHVIGPEQGFTLPGVTLVCGDSHTSTHGAFGSLAFGIGTSEVEHVLATQTLVQKKSKNFRIQVDGELPPNCTSKDVVLHVIGAIGTAGGNGSVIEFCGSVIEKLSMEARMSMCNMSIEAGARAGMVAPDEITFEYVKGRPMAPKGDDWERAVAWWKTLKSDPGAKFDKTVIIDGADILPTITWGTSPEDTVAITGVVPSPDDEPDPQRKAGMVRALEYMGLTPGTKMTDVPVDVVFIGSCTNSRIEDLRAAAAVAKGRKVAEHVQAIVVPGSGLIKEQAIAEGLDVIFKEAGFDFREAGCSMCLAMNPDKLKPQERCAATSNRNFEGRQGQGGRTHLMSPAMAAAAGIVGKLADVRELLADGGAAEMAVTAARQIEPEVIPVIQAAAEASGLGGGAGGMKKFTTMSGCIAPMDIPNCDTDKIIPARFLKTIKRTGLGVSAFADLRYTDGAAVEDPTFVLNQPDYRDGKAQFLVCGDNFGCGSSREHAPWAIKDMGILCLISSSFADIFMSNCFKNGMLPIVLPKSQVDDIMQDARDNLGLSVDLEAQTVTRSGGAVVTFEIDSFLKHCLVNGLDQIGLTIQKEDKIVAFEALRTEKTPWLDGVGYSPAGGSAAP